MKSSLTMGLALALLACSWRGVAAQAVAGDTLHITLSATARIARTMNHGDSSATRSGWSPGACAWRAPDGGGVKHQPPRVPVPAPLTLIALHSNVNTVGSSTGAINLTVSGGAAPYRFVWSTGATTEDLTGLPAGTYSVTVTDSHGHRARLTVVIGQPAALALSESGTRSPLGQFPSVCA